MISRIPAVAVPPQVTSNVTLIDQAQSNQLKVQPLSPTTAFHNHTTTHEQKSDTPHIDRFV